MLKEHIFCNRALLKHLLHKNGRTFQNWKLRPLRKTNTLSKTACPAPAINP